MTLLTLFIIRKYVAYKLKPIYSIVLSRNVHTQEILDELKDKHVENISEELTAWADNKAKNSIWFLLMKIIRYIFHKESKIILVQIVILQ